MGYARSALGSAIATQVKRYGNTAIVHKDPTQKSMFSEEQAKQMQQMLDSAAQMYVQKTTEAINQYSQNLEKKLPQIIDARLGELDARIVEKFTPLVDPENQRSLIQETLDRYLQQLAEEADEEGGEDTSEAGQRQSVARESQAIAEMRKQMAEQAKAFETMKNRVQEAEKRAEEERRQRDEMARQQKVQQLEESVLEQIRGRVRPGTERQLLTLLKTDGVLKEDPESGQVFLKARNEYGIEDEFPVDKAIQSVVKERYPHYEDVRPGTGTGAIPASVRSSSPPSAIADANAETRLFNVRNGRASIDDSTLDTANFQDILKDLAKLSQ